MQREARKYLSDIQQAATLLAEFTAGKQFSDYEGDAMLRAAVEREFEIIGVALSELANLDKALAARISEYPRIIAFRNIIAHGYAYVDSTTVWDIVQIKTLYLHVRLKGFWKKHERTGSIPFASKDKFLGCFHPSKTPDIPIVTK